MQTSQPSVQSFVSIERETVQRISNLCYSIGVDFQIFEVPYSTDTEKPNYFIEHCLSQLEKALDELGKVYNLCSNFLSNSNNLTPDEISLIKDSLDARIDQGIRANEILATDKIDLSPLYNLKEKFDDVDDSRVISDNDFPFLFDQKK